MSETFRALVTSVSRRTWLARCTVLSMHLVIAVASAVCAFLLRYDAAIPAEGLLCLAYGVIVWCITKPIICHYFRANFGFRHFSTTDLLYLTAAKVTGSLLGWITLLAICPFRFPISIVVLDAMLGLLFSAGLRGFLRMGYEYTTSRRRLSPKRTLIYGAGDAGAMLLKEARCNPHFGYEICGFIDDVKAVGQSVCGIRVLGAGSDLKRVLAAQQIGQILIAVPSADSSQMFRITGLCQDSGVPFLTMPSMAEILSGTSRHKIREVAVEDVLGRSTVRLDDQEILDKVAGQVVLVTGAAGSIGSELCRQVARFGPAKLVAFELSETALFFLEREINESFPGVVFCPEVGNIQNIQRVRDVFAQYTPSLVLHAAAYKHVPLMEKHIFEAVENNVFGTYNLGVVASEYGARDFVMISSDKAVNPTNMMGTTKRVAELVVRSLQTSGTRFVSVRFGNVLGSNGSVVPIFKSQIAAGGPVRITHPDMERFFMTIPEASQLVLQACTMGRGGEIFVLDMGQPVKIVDLARRLIQLSGLRPEIDVKIEFTGMRPGEKLFEEINMADEQMLSTHHDKIKIFSGSSLLPERMSSHLHRLRKACEQRNARSLVRELTTLVPDYKVSREVAAYTMTESLVKLGLVLQEAASEVKTV